MGKYRIVGLLGCGGMGCAYTAVDSGNREVVVKVPNFSSPISPGILIDKLKVERDLLKRIWQSGGHENIVRYIDDGEERGVPILVVEKIDGVTLKKAAESRGGFDAPTALGIMTRLAYALKFLHQLGIVHRDFCPDNIMLRRDGMPIVIDFGTAKMGFTQRASQISGKPCIAPELGKGIALEASDIWGWGSTLMMIMRSRVANLGDAYDTFMKYYISTSNRLVDEPCKLVDCSGASVDLNRILRKSIDPDYSRRYRNVDELLADLQAPVAAPPQPTYHRYVLYVDGRSVMLDPSRTYTLGSASKPSADILVADPNGYISARHARLRFDHSRNVWIVEDLCSTNGTKVVRRSGGEVIVYHGHRGSGGARAAPCGSTEVYPGDVIVLAFSLMDPSVHYREIQLGVV